MKDYWRYVRPYEMKTSSFLKPINSQSALGKRELVAWGQVGDKQKRIEMYSKRGACICSSIDDPILSLSA